MAVRGGPTVRPPVVPLHEPRCFPTTTACTDLTAFCYGPVTDYVAWPCVRSTVTTNARPVLPVKVEKPGDAQGDGRKGGGMVLCTPPPRPPTPPQKTSTRGEGEGEFGAAQGSSNSEFIKGISGGKATNKKIAQHSQLHECRKRKAQYMHPEPAKSQSGLGGAMKAMKLEGQWSSYQRVGVNLGQPDQLLGPVLTGQVVPPLASDFKTTSTTPGVGFFYYEMRSSSTDQVTGPPARKRKESRTTSSPARKRKGSHED